MAESTQQLTKQLRQTEAKYRSLVERIPVVVYTASLDETSTTTCISPQIEPALGFAAEEWQADPDLWTRQLHPPDPERVLVELHVCRAVDALFHSEYRMIAKNGEIIWIRDEAPVIKIEMVRLSSCRA